MLSAKGATLAQLDELGLRLKDVDLGGIDAESDFKLDEYFVTTPYVRSALSGRHTLFLGRKGSGKSALFRQLPRLVQDGGESARAVLTLTPDQYAWSALKQYREQGLLLEQAHTNAWKVTLAVEVAGKLLSLERDWLAESEDACRTIRQFLTDNL